MPQARAALERNQKECGAQPAEAVASAGPLRSTLASGTQFAKERAAAAGQGKAACEARSEELRKQLKSLEEELGAP
ncbi:hypothetical protein D3C72_2469190 [compost metagenome]